MVLELLKAALLPAVILIVVLIANSTIRKYLVGDFKYKRGNKYG